MPRVARVAVVEGVVGGAVDTLVRAAARFLGGMVGDVARVNHSLIEM